MTFGEKLRRARREKGLTQAELANQAGLGLRTIIAYEKGETYPQKRSTYQTLADILGVQADDLHNEETTASAPPLSRTQWENSKRRYIPEFKNYLSRPFQIDNVGGGAALNSQLIFAKDGTKRRGVTFYTLKPDDNFYFHIFSESITDEMYGTYTLELRYDDILGNSYSQKYPIELKDDPVDGKFTWSFDLSGSQCEIGR